MYTIISLAIILIIICSLGYAGGKMAESNGRSFTLGVLVGLFLNIPGLILMAYIGDSANDRSSDPDFHHYKMII